MRRTEWRQKSPGMRAQVELPAVGIALLVLTVTVVLGVGIATTALQSAERPAVEQRTAMSLSDQLLVESSPITTRQNVINESALRDLDPTDLHDEYGLPNGMEAQLRLDGDPIVTAGNPEGGTTVERLVLVERTETHEISASFETANHVTIPQRTERATVEIAPFNGTIVQTVSVNDRVVLANDSGLDGTFNIYLSPYESARIEFEASGSMTETDTTIEYNPRETRKATLSVVIDE